MAKHTDTSAPHNPATGNNYTGGNADILAEVMLALGTADTRFTTFKGARTLGMSVAKGQHACAELKVVRKVEVKRRGKTEEQIRVKTFKVFHFSQLVELETQVAA